MCRHRGIGMNKARKKKPSPLVPAQSEPMNVEASGGGAPAASPEPGPSSSAAPQSTPAESQPKREDRFLKIVQRRLQRLRKEKKRLKIIERRWEKTKKTYHGSGKAGYWDAPSVVNRKEGRMMTIDMELGKARALVGHWSTGYRRARSYYVLEKRWDQNMTPENLAILRVAEDRHFDWDPDAVPLWKTAWPGLSRNFYDHIADQYGLAVTWGVMHASELIAPEDPNDPGGKLKMAAEKAAHEADVERRSQQLDFENDGCPGLAGYTTRYRGMRDDAQYQAAFEAWRTKSEVCPSMDDLD